MLRYKSSMRINKTIIKATIDSPMSANMRDLFRSAG